LCYLQVVVEDSVATTNAAFHMICVFVVVLNQDCGRVLMTFDGYGQCNHPTGVCYPQISAFPWKAHHNLKLRMALKRICMSSMSCLDVVCLKEICSGCRILPPTTLYIGVSIMLRCLYPSMLKWNFKLTLTISLWLEQGCYWLLLAMSLEC
jgi:hypothetical protein